MNAAHGLLKMSELAERSGVSAGTIKHYLREGLLGEGDEIVRTSRNMAYYPPEYVERIRLIKRLQEERFMPLRVIRGVMDAEPERAPRSSSSRTASSSARSSSARRERMSARRGAPALRRPAQRARSARRARRPDARPRAATTPTTCKIIEAISRFRAGGYDEALGFTVFDTLRYRDALEPLVAEEVRMLLDRLAGEVERGARAGDHRAGAEPLRELIGAMHSKLLLAELSRQRNRD